MCMPIRSAEKQTKLQWKKRGSMQVTINANTGPKYNIKNAQQKF